MKGRRHNKWLLIQKMHTKNAALFPVPVLALTRTSFSENSINIMIIFILTFFMLSVTNQQRQHWYSKIRIKKKTIMLWLRMIKNANKIEKGLYHKEMLGQVCFCYLYFNIIWKHIHLSYHKILQTLAISSMRVLRGLY